MREPTATTARHRNRIDALLRRSPVQSYFRARSAGRLAVLAYHGIDDPEGFAAQLDRLRRIARPISLEKLTTALATGTPLPAHSVLLTFDDGDRSVLEHGLPLLAERGIPAVTFVVAELIGTERPFWWREVEYLIRHGGTARCLPSSSPPAAAVRAMKRMPDPDRRRALEELRVSAARSAPPQRQMEPDELRKLAEGGVEIGNHTLSHPSLDQCDASVVRTEIIDAHRRLDRWLGAPPRAFAYPNGQVDPRAEQLLAELGYAAGFLFDHRLAGPLPAHPLRISRLRVNSTTSRNRFETILSGLHPAVHRLRGGM